MNGMDMIASYKNLISSLESQELASSVNGSASPQIYGQLLAIYLLMNDLPNAKLLWKRIPKEIKQTNPEIQSVWNVGVKLFKREFSDIYSLVDSVDWPTHLRNIMNCIKESTRQRMQNLIGTAFSCIRFEDFSKYLGFTEQESMERIRTLNWKYDEDDGGKFVYPDRKTLQTDDNITANTFEELTMKLTEYVSFLEN